VGRVSGKVAIVTGAASRPGLGSATAIRLAEEGAIVVLTDVDGAGAQAVAADIRAGGGSATAHAHDVASEPDWDRVFTAILTEHARIDIVVNNAGVAVLRPLAALSPADWSRQIAINLTSVYHGTSRAVAAMRITSTRGTIVNIASVCADIGVPMCSAYAAAKAGLVGFSRTVAIETAREGIRVNTVHPGSILTNMTAVALADNPDGSAQIDASIPMGRMGEPLDIANMILFLASDEAKYITGAQFTVDGGLTAQ
jgi:NAD(P)-dependent dehydrogenase (short-subunit alcohol dehydrogenase family)